MVVYIKEYPLLIMDIPGTIEQSFLIMLQERIERLEDEFLRLEKSFNTTRYHRLEIKTEIDDNIPADKKLTEILNEIFKKRSQFHPVFAAWSWSIHNNILFINFIFTTKEPIYMNIMKEYISHPDITYFNIMDLYTFIQYFNYYFHDEDEGDEKYCYEYWHLYYGYLYDVIDNTLTEEPFITSKNYSSCKEHQKRLRKWLFQQTNWVDILRIFI